MALRPASRVRLDTADVSIIDLLVADGRANARAMAATTGLSEETVADRMRALIDRNIIGISAILDWRAAGFQWDLFLAIRVGAAGAQVVIDELTPHDEVVSIYEVFGPVDVVAHVLCRDRAAMLEFVSTTVPRIDGINGVEILLALDTVKYFHQFARAPVTGSLPTLPEPVVDLTPVDHGIIEALMRNGRVAHREVARDLGVADGTIRTRLRRLISVGLLRICAQVDPSNSGMVGAQALVGISVHGADRALVARRLAGVSEVITISAVTGHFDLLCYVVARTRAELIDHIATEVRLISGVRAVETWEVTGVRKHVGCWARW
jgi:DNA-binding Lrp family transcriptional regulator